MTDPKPRTPPEIPESLRGPAPEIRGPLSDALRRRLERDRRQAAARGVDNALWQQLMSLAVVGSNFAFSVLGGALIGFGIDWLAGTGPLFLLIFAGVGLISGGWGFIRQANAMTKPKTGKPKAADTGKPQDPTPP
ncbi:MAG: AtpZ/AtpI family protein [Phycisphaerales bacterium]|nr:MAG: AtpZ/AtpI family protein [Phycisphaerales bacterium]